MWAWKTHSYLTGAGAVDFEACCDVVTIITQLANILGLQVRFDARYAQKRACAFHELLHWSSYWVFQKTDPLVYFDDNFGKYGPILTILSLLQHEIYDAHLTFIIFPLYLVKQTLMLVSMWIFLDHAAKQISMYSNG